MYNTSKLTAYKKGKYYILNDLTLKWVYTIFFSNPLRTLLDAYRRSQEPEVTVLGQAKRYSRLRETRENNIIKNSNVSAALHAFKERICQNWLLTSRSLFSHFSPLNLNNLYSTYRFPFQRSFKSTTNIIKFPAVFFHKVLPFVRYFRIAPFICYCTSYK